MKRRRCLWVKPDGARRTRSDRAGSLGTPVGVRALYAELRAVVRELLQAKAARQVQDEVGLVETVGFLLNPTERGIGEGG